MALEIRKRLDFWINFFDIEWEWDNTSVDGVFEKIVEALPEWCKVVFNFEKLVFCNSKFLWNMFYFIEQLWLKKWKACIIWINKWIIDTFEVVWMFDMLPIYENLQDVLNYLNNN